MKRLIFLLLFFGVMATAMRAEDFKKLSLPRQEQLSSDRVQQVLQDSEGYLWYATEGGGVCRDDGRQISVFRSDAEHPDLLGSNDVVCLAEAGSRIIIGTFHGAYVLDKQDYTIRRLTDVDDKHVDDIIIAADGHWWLTSNKKVYEFDGDGNLLNTYLTGDKYIARIHEDRQGILWITQWDGGLMTLRDGQFTPAPWSVDAAPSAIIDDPAGDGLLIGTFGQGIVRYQPADGSLEILEQTGRSVCIDMKVTNNHLWMSTTSGLQHFIVGDWMEASSIDTAMTTLRRITLDKHGNLLVANNEEESFALSCHPLQPWYSETPLTRVVADSIRVSHDQPLLDVLRELAVIDHGLVGFLIAVEADMADFGDGNQGLQSFDHSHSGPQDGHDGEFASGHFLCDHLADGGFNLHILKRKVAGDFISMAPTMVCTS